MDQVSLSPMAFFGQAGPVGKVVIGLLLVASIWCWALIIEGIINAFRFGAALKKNGIRTRFRPCCVRSSTPAMKPFSAQGAWTPARRATASSKE